VCRAKPDVPFGGGNKIELKKCAVGRTKHTEGSARGVGLKVVRLLYGLYVFGYLSKWFAFLFLVPDSLSACVVHYTCSQRFGYAQCPEGHCV
jgi:hypothetical protein